MGRATLAVARKELHQILRDLRTLLVVLFVPLFFLWLYGYALNFDVRNVPLAVQDFDLSRASREIVAGFANSGYFDLVETVDTHRDVTTLLDTGRARAVLIVPPGTGERVLSGEPAHVQVLMNGDNANTASTVMAYASAIVRDVAAELGSSGPNGAREPPIVLEPRVWFNPELKSTLFLVPGLVAYIAMITAVVSTALSVVREKERGTMEQIRMAPIGSLSFVLGKTVPYLALSFLSSMGILVVAMLLFDMPMRGSWWLLMLLTALFLLSALGMGLFISTVAVTQQMAFQLALVVSFLPTFILSGFVFPIASMPLVPRLVSYIVPARYYLRALRAVVLKGVGISLVTSQIVALGIFAVAVLVLSAVRLARQHEG